MAGERKFLPMKGAIEAALAKIKKWYMAIDQSDIYFICLGMCSSSKGIFY